MKGGGARAPRIFTRFVEPFPLLFRPRKVRKITKNQKETERSALSAFENFTVATTSYKMRGFTFCEVQSNRRKHSPESFIRCGGTVSCFSLFLIEFGKTKQIVVTLVATAFKAMLPVAKTNGRLFGRELYAGNIYYLFENLFIHTFSSSAYKKVHPRRNAPKKCFPSNVATQTLSDTA